MDDNGRCFRPSLQKALANVAPDFSMDRKARLVMQKTVGELNMKMITEVKKANKFGTKKNGKFSVREVQRMMKELFPSEIASHANKEGLKAIQKFQNGELVFKVSKPPPRDVVKIMNTSFSKSLKLVMQEHAGDNVMFDRDARLFGVNLLKNLTLNLSAKTRAFCDREQTNSLHAVKRAADDVLGEELSAYANAEAMKMLLFYENGSLHVPRELEAEGWYRSAQPRMPRTKSTEALKFVGAYVTSHVPEEIEKYAPSKEPRPMRIVDPEPVIPFFMSGPRRSTILQQRKSKSREPSWETGVSTIEPDDIPRDLAFELFGYGINKILKTAGVAIQPESCFEACNRLMSAAQCIMGHLKQKGPRVTPQDISVSMIKAFPESQLGNRADIVANRMIKFGKIEEKSSETGIVAIEPDYMPENLGIEMFAHGVNKVFQTIGLSVQPEACWEASNRLLYAAQRIMRHMKQKGSKVIQQDISTAMVEAFPTSLLGNRADIVARRAVKFK